MSHSPGFLKIKCPVCLTELDVPGITASPAVAAEMLEALEWMIDVIDSSTGVMGWHLSGEVAQWNDFEGVDDIRAAIRKARGEE